MEDLAAPCTCLDTAGYTSVDDVVAPGPGVVWVLDPTGVARAASVVAAPQARVHELIGALRAIPHEHLVGIVDLLAPSGPPGARGLRRGCPAPEHVVIVWDLHPGSVPVHEVLAARPPSAAEVSALMVATGRATAALEPLSPALARPSGADLMIGADGMLRHWCHDLVSGADPVHRAAHDAVRETAALGVRLLDGAAAPDPAQRRLTAILAAIAAGPDAQVPGPGTLAVHCQDEVAPADRASWQARRERVLHARRLTADGVGVPDPRLPAPAPAALTWREQLRDARRPAAAGGTGEGPGRRPTGTVRGLRGLRGLRDGPRAVGAIGALSAGAAAAFALSGLLAGGTLDPSLDPARSALALTEERVALVARIMSCAASAPQEAECSPAGRSARLEAVAVRGSPAHHQDVELVERLLADPGWRTQAQSARARGVDAQVRRHEPGAAVVEVAYELDQGGATRRSSATLQLTLTDAGWRVADVLTPQR